ncbi:ankyrin repeat and SOCS box protein 3-like [Manduca sexta]|uniref:ankyrin repeat and SOCS box protein 3-like n=1 Tax=Manduca sexta TaxID=7130 RepID=UPI00188EC229|nr:ankyrin repeat and SOCS box protein 3-like [Manduca sexta]
MDFSSHNPSTSNSLNIAARKDDVKILQRLLKKINPNCVDNRGWTCLHEAAYNDSYDCLLAILNHPACRPLVQTYEGHTALYLAVRNRCSIRTIKLLLDHVKDIANYGSTEGVTPLHVVSGQGRIDVMQLLIDYGAMIDVQDFDGDTPLHDAVLEMQPAAVACLLHAGANPEIQNDPGCYTPFHLACYRGCLETVQIIYPFVTDINQVTKSGYSALMLALGGVTEKIIDFLLENGADPHLKNCDDEMALDLALNNGYDLLFEKIFRVTDKKKINRNIILRACKPHYFKTRILEILLNGDLGPEFFDINESFYVLLEQIGDLCPTYQVNAPLNWFLNICSYIYDTSPDKFREFFYLFLMHGMGVNAANVNECPPIVYIHYCIHSTCFMETFKILIEHGCNVDYCTSSKCVDKNKCVPDAFLASLTSDTTTIPVMLPYSLHCDPGTILQFANDNGILGRIPQTVQSQLIAMIDKNANVKAEYLRFYVPSLKHLSRFEIRRTLRTRKGGVKSTTEFLNIIDSLPVPQIIRYYLRYM